MFDIVLLNSIFILIPILCYLIYIVYENVFGIKNSSLFFTFSIITSLYLITKYSMYFNFKTDVMKILLLLSLLKDRKALSIIISIYASMYFDLNYDYNIIFITIKYLVQLVLFLVVMKDTKYEWKLVIFYIVEIIFGICIRYVPISYLLLSNIIYILLTYILFKLLNRVEKVIDIYGTIRNVEYEKNFRESLFKVTHEIKNPIAVCKGYLDMLNVNDSKQVNKYIPIVKEEIDRTLILIEDFLNLTRLNVDKSIMDISMLIEDIIISINTLLNSKNITFEYNIVDDEVFIEGDYNRLKQVFINLVKNSVESIKNSNGLIRLNMLVDKNVVITVEDNGIGMDKDTLKRIGEPFFTTKEKGTGLGVKLSSEIIELHGGRIKYYSKLNKGTVVKIELPLYKK